jgi:hypothetical protein
MALASGRPIHAISAAATAPCSALVSMVTPERRLLLSARHENLGKYARAMQKANQSSAHLPRRQALRGPSRPT